MDNPLLGRAVDDLRTAKELREVQDIVRTTARKLVYADGATFVLREGELCFYAAEDAISPLWKGQRFPIGQCISGWAMVHGETAVIEDITKDPRIPQEAYRPTFVRSLMMVPIGRGIGATGVYWARRHAASDSEAALVGALADAAAEAIQRIGVSRLPAGPPEATPVPAPVRALSAEAG